jgi:hypothetical protein
MMVAKKHFLSSPLSALKRKFTGVLEDRPAISTEEKQQLDRLNQYVYKYDPRPEILPALGQRRSISR